MTIFRVLGPLELHIGGTIRPISSRRQRALLTRLLLDPGRVVSADALVESAWADEEQPKGPRAALQTQMSRLRGFLGPEGKRLVTSAPGYRLDTPKDDIDAYVFDRVVWQGREAAGHDPRRALALYEQALGMWRGEAYAEFAGSFAQPEAIRLEELRISVAEGRVELLLAVGDVAGAVAAAQYLTTSHPLRERPYVLLMRSLAADGRQGESLAVYQRVRERLADDLGTEPSEELQQVHLQVLRHEVDTPARSGPPAPAVDDVPTSPVPLAVSSFIGRQTELETIRSALGSSRMVSLIGPGGVGKTRLAIETASRLDPSQQLVWVELASLRDQTSVSSAMLDALGAADRPSPKPLDALITALRHRDVILLVDNCEHLIDEAAQVISSIIRQCPAVRVLATSREPLSIDGEYVVPIRPFPIANSEDSSAVQLLTDRLRSAGYPVDPQDHETQRLAVEVSRRLDGLPLALELAAAQAPALGLGTVGQATNLLTLASRRSGGQHRHRSLRDVLSWSYDLLSADEQALLRRLSVFPGRFSLSWIQDVCADALVPAQRVPGILASLINKSLVVRQPNPAVGERAYSLLSTVARFAEEQLDDAAEAEEFRALHARFIVTWAEETGRAIGTTNEEPFEMFAVCTNDLRAAQTWAHQNDADMAMRLAAALHRYADIRIDYEILGWAEQALCLPHADQHPLRPVVLASAASAAAHAHGDPERAERLCREAVSLVDPQDEHAAIPLNMFGHTLHHRDPAAAAVIHRRAWHAARLAGDHVGETEAAGGLALALNSLGNGEGRDRWVARAWAAKPDRSALASAMVNYVTGECMMKSAPDEALTYLDKSYEAAYSVGANLITSMALTSRVTLQARISASPEGVASYKDVLEHWQESGSDVNEWNVWITLRNLIPVLSQNRQDAAALSLHYAISHSPQALRTHGQEWEMLQRAVDQSERRLGAPDAKRIRLRYEKITIHSAIELAFAAISRILDEPGAKPAADGAQGPDDATITA
ncbi:BTAD domain-containing putative transcriptional regulator [Streptomyces sp. NPDC056661]|uniref:AfsR/SARP family transcriptional regulator n=1 Tax=Streptomyces sp. NPDC056661 TaxID=3345898 RepID=UPI0036D0C78A